MPTVLTVLNVVPAPSVALKRGKPGERGRSPPTTWTRAAPNIASYSQCNPTLRQGQWGRRQEPTNHLDAGSVAWLERTLAGFRGTVVAVTHDRCAAGRAAWRGRQAPPRRRGAPPAACAAGPAAYAGMRACQAACLLGWPWQVVNPEEAVACGRIFINLWQGYGRAGTRPGGSRAVCGGGGAASSWTTWPAGSWSWTAGRASRSRVRPRGARRQAGCGRAAPSPPPRLGTALSASLSRPAQRRRSKRGDRKRKWVAAIAAWDAPLRE